MKSWTFWLFDFLVLLLEDISALFIIVIALRKWALIIEPMAHSLLLSHWTDVGPDNWAAILKGSNSCNMLTPCSFVLNSLFYKYYFSEQNGLYQIETHRPNFNAHTARYLSFEHVSSRVWSCKKDQWPSWAQAHNIQHLHDRSSNLTWAREDPRLTLHGGRHEPRAKDELLDVDCVQMVTIST